jgi:hypothetical protein
MSWAQFNKESKQPESLKIPVQRENTTKRIFGFLPGRFTDGYKTSVLIRKKSPNA